jgi:hypothetical protein
LDLNKYLLLEEAIDEVDENPILKPKELSDLLGNPGLHHIHLDFDISTYHQPQAQNHQIRASPCRQQLYIPKVFYAHYNIIEKQRA